MLDRVGRRRQFSHEFWWQLSYEAEWNSPRKFQLFQVPAESNRGIGKALYEEQSLTIDGKQIRQGEKPRDPDTTCVHPVLQTSEQSSHAPNELLVRRTLGPALESRTTFGPNPQILNEDQRHLHPLEHFISREQSLAEIAIDG